MFSLYWANYTHHHHTQKRGGGGDKVWLLPTVHHTQKGGGGIRCGSYLYTLVNVLSVCRYILTLIRSPQSSIIEASQPSPLLIGLLHTSPLYSVQCGAVCIENVATQSDAALLWGCHGHTCSATRTDILDRAISATVPRHLFFLAFLC